MSKDALEAGSHASDAEQHRTATPIVPDLAAPAPDDDIGRVFSSLSYLLDEADRDSSRPPALPEHPTVPEAPPQAADAAPIPPATTTSPALPSQPPPPPSRLPVLPPHAPPERRALRIARRTGAALVMGALLIAIVGVPRRLSAPVVAAMPATAQQPAALPPAFTVAPAAGPTAPPCAPPAPTILPVAPRPRSLPRLRVRPAERALSPPPSLSHAFAPPLPPPARPSRSEIPSFGPVVIEEQ